MVQLSWADVCAAVEKLTDGLDSANYDGVYGVPRGGVIPAAMLATRLGLPVLDTYSPQTLIVDDIIDSGKTRKRYPKSSTFVSIANKTRDLNPESTWGGIYVPYGDWVVFPWENAKNETGPEDSIRRVLQYIGEDPDREGLIETPKRVLKAFTELTAGYQEDAGVHLSKLFDETSDQMVVSSGIEFVSLCEHHMLPFIGTATVGYLPGDKVVGLSKLARTVDVFARRLQVQERLTGQIADALVEHLQPEGCGVIVRAKHQCQGIRGAQKRDAMMTTSALRGAFLDDPKMRSEFLSLQ